MSLYILYDRLTALRPNSSEQSLIGGPSSAVVCDGEYSRYYTIVLDCEVVYLAHCFSTPNVPFVRD